MIRLIIIGIRIIKSIRINKLNLNRIKLKKYINRKLNKLI